LSCSTVSAISNVPRAESTWRPPSYASALLPWISALEIESLPLLTKPAPPTLRAAFDRHSDASICTCPPATYIAPPLIAVLLCQQQRSKMTRPPLSSKLATPPPFAAELFTNRHPPTILLCWIDTAPPDIRAVLFSKIQSLTCTGALMRRGKKQSQCPSVFTLERERERERALLGIVHNGGSRAAPAHGLRITM